MTQAIAVTFSLSFSLNEQTKWSSGEAFGINHQGNVVTIELDAALFDDESMTD